VPAVRKGSGGEDHLTGLSGEEKEQGNSEAWVGSQGRKVCIGGTIDLRGGKVHKGVLKGEG